MLYLSDLFVEFIQPLFMFIQVDKRVYFVYLSTAMLMAYFVLFSRYDNLRLATKHLFNVKVWFGNSSQIDVKWIFANQILFVLFIAPLLLSQIALAMLVFRTLVDCFGSADIFRINTTIVFWIFTACFFIVEDFSRFFIHFLYHKVPFLWRFHAIHHSANRLTPLTLYRVHFIEFVFNSLRSLFVAGVVSGIFMYLFEGKIGFIEIFGANVFSWLFNMAGANLRHSHIPLSYGVFEHIFISPKMHQIHHSSAKIHLDKNFGATFSIWDKLFGSWVASKNQKVKRFGLYKQKSPQQFLKQWKGL